MASSNVPRLQNSSPPRRRDEPITCDYDNDKRAVADLSVEQATALIEALQQIIA